MELPIIVAEVGLNHNGHVQLAKDIIMMVVEAADAQDYPREKVLVKFQKRDPEISTPVHMRDTMRISPVSGNYMTYLEYRHEIEFGIDEYTEIDHYCKFLGIDWFVSVWDLPSIHFVQNNFWNMPYIKIPSPHITKLDLIRRAAEHDGGLIISTGMSDEDMVQDAFSEAYMRATSLTILACTSTYPCPVEETNLSAIKTLQQLYGQHASIGFSSHNISWQIPVYSVNYGAQMIEAHATIDRSLPGSDQGASLERPAWERIFREVQKACAAEGDGKIAIQESELEKLESLRGN